MTRLLIATAAFLVTHYIASTPLRPQLARILGTNGYLMLYSAVALITLGAMVWTYYRAPFIGVWYVPALRYAPAIAMPFALMLIACGLLTRNPGAVGGERLLREREAAHGILRITRHPLMWGIALWAASHMLARGDAAALLFFGAFLLLALSGTVLIDRRKRAALGGAWERYAAVTSNLPFAAIAKGSNRLRAAEIGGWRAAVALALYVILWWSHSLLFGARPY
ncbi:MAG TPA: NnrU family protein [Burkholderiales bacterium]|nr:NnrU family protein [Burkholderiales bacterium]